jgi:ribosomal protein S18 acetylase RimI-like enzyme
MGKTQQMEVRELSVDDRSATASLWSNAGLTRPWNDPDSDFDRALEGPTSAVLGAFSAGQLAATVMVGHDGHRGWVYYLAVDPQQRRRGLGRRMMNEAEHWLRSRGAVKVNLMVRHSNADALSFYEHLGYIDADVAVLARWLTT